MKKNNLLRYILPVLILILAYGLWQIFNSILQKRERTEVWKLVPSDAVFALETPNLTTFLHKSDSMSAWANLSQIPYFKQMTERTHLLDSLKKAGFDMEKYFANKLIISSLHITATSGIDYLFFIPFETTENALLQNIIAHICKKENYIQDKRSYQGIDIQEVINKPKGKVFSYILYKNHLIGSFTPLLIEDVIRNVSKMSKENFYSLNEELFDTEKTDSPDGHFYFNYKNLPKFIEVFASDSSQKKLANLPNFSSGMFAEINFLEKEIRLKGKNTAQENDYLAIFQKQNSSKITSLHQFIPKRTAVLYRMGFENGNDLYKNLQNYSKIQSPEIQEKHNFWSNNYNFEAKELFNNVKDEIALAVLEALDNSPSEQLVFLNLKEPKKVRDLMFQFAKNSAKDTLVYENYGDLKISRIDLPEFPKYLLGEMFNGFAKTHFTLINNYLILGNSVQAIKTLSDDLDKNEVWAKIPQAENLLKNINPQTNISIQINLLRSWNAILKHLKPDWQPIFEKYKRNLLRFEWWNLEIQSNKTQFDSQLSIFHKKLNAPPSLENNKNLLQSVFSVSLGKNLISKPLRVKNYVDKTNEILVQDASFYLHLVANNGQKRWSVPIFEPIISKIEQIDIFANGKLQYVFATKSKIVILDRLGRAVNPFPVKVPAESPIQHFSVIDYDNSKNYRFATSDQHGNVFLYSKYGTLMDGFKPKKLAIPLANPLKHIRSEGNDYLLAILANGTVNALKRNAQSFEKFPLNFDVELLPNSVYVQHGITLENTLINLFSAKGELIQFNLLGKVADRNQFGRDDEVPTFMMCQDEVDKTDWLVARQDQEKIIILSKNGKTLFEKIYANASPKIVQYFNFGANLEVVAINDSQEKKTFLYYLDGNLASNLAIESDREIVMDYSENREEFLLYRCVLDKLSLLKVIKN